MIVPGHMTTMHFNDLLLSGATSNILIQFKNINVGGNDIYIDGDYISTNGVQITTYINSDENITFGKTISKEMIVNLINSDDYDDIDWTKEFTVWFGVKEGNNYEYVCLGYFIGEKPKRKNEMEIEFIAHDLIYYLDKNSVANNLKNLIVFPKTMAQIYQNIFNILNCDATMQNPLIHISNKQYASYPFQEGITYQKIIDWIAESNCSNVIGDRNYPNTALTKRFSTTSNYSIYKMDCNEIHIEDETIPKVDTIIISKSDNSTPDYVYPIGSTSKNFYRIVDNPILLGLTDNEKTTACQEMLSIFNTIGSYHPMTIDVNGGVLVEAGDIVHYYDGVRNTDIPVFKTTLYWNGSCRCVYECTGNNDKSLTNEQQGSYELNGIIDDAINNNNNNYVSKEQAQDTFPNLTNASISPYSMIIPQGADLDTYEEPGTYICLSGTDAATMSNVPPGVIANFKLIVNRNTGDGNPNWYGCQIVQSNDLIHIRKHQATSYGTWEQIGYTNVADTWAEFLAKAKARAEITFTFFGNTTVTNKLCGRSQKSFGTCVYTGGYLCWNLTTYDDYSYYGWWKESDDSIKVYPIQVPNGLVTIVYEKTGVTIPNNSTFTIDLSSDVPSSYDIYSAEINVKYNESEWWSLPYFNDAMDKGMWIRRISNNKITIRCSDSGWGSNNRVQVIAHMRRS